MEPLTWPEFVRAARWPGAFSVAVGNVCGFMVKFAGGPGWLRALVAGSVSLFLMLLTCRVAAQRALWRKWNRLDA